MATEILTAPGVAPAADPIQTLDIPIIRNSPDRSTLSANLGLLAELAGSWRGQGFNLIARPDFHNQQNLYLQLSQTLETLQVDPIGSGIPNRGFGQDDIQLFGLTYLQKISDLFTGGALHIEPGIWVTQPATTYPVETAPAKSQIIARMGSIPHGNALLAQGTASTFTGAPVLKTASAQYNGSAFPSFNSTPFGAAAPVIINAEGTSEKANAAANGVPPFTEYDLTVAASATNPRTPFATAPPEPALPAAINGVPMQTVINDPITLLQAVINQQVKQGFTFEGTVLNISTQKTLTFFKNPNSKPTDPTVAVTPVDAAGGIENIPFLEGGEPTGSQGPNADTATVYATFWLEKVSHPSFPTFLQLQYAQMVVLNFPIFTALHPPVTTPPTPPALVVLGWPHISVATLTKAFN
jgi:hypothetical protein